MEHVCSHAHHRLGAYKQAVLIASIALGAQVWLVYLSGSLALFSDTVHLASDNLFLMGSLAVVWKASMLTEEGATLLRKYAAHVGIILLIAGAWHINKEANEHFITPSHVANGWVLAGGIIGLVANWFMFRAIHANHEHEFVPVEKSTRMSLARKEPLEHRHAHDSVVEWHVIFDFLFSVVVTFSAIGSLVFGIEGIDAVVAEKLSFFMFILAGFLFCQTLQGGHQH